MGKLGYRESTLRTGCMKSGLLMSGRWIKKTSKNSVGFVSTTNSDILFVRNDAFLALIANQLDGLPNFFGDDVSESALA